MSSTTLLSINADPVGCISGMPSLVAYCGNNSDLARSLIENYGLKPVYEKSTQRVWRVAAIDAALRMRELDQNKD